jgi:hypothetical protein
MRIFILVLGFSLLVATQNHGRSVDFSEGIAKTTRLTSRQARSLFPLGRWPELGQLQEEPEFRNLSEKYKTTIGKELNKIAPIHWLTVTTFKSRYFNSEYHLIYFSSSLSVLGALVPQTVFYAVKEYGGAPVSLSSDGPDFDPKWPPNLDRALSYVIHDYVGGCLKGESALDAATDAISLVCPERPVVFLQDIFEAYECSNTLADSLIWEQYTIEDTVRTLLSSFRWLDTRRNVYLNRNYGTASYDSTEFVHFRDAVESMNAKLEPDGSVKVTAFTWSPGTGVLRRWVLTFEEIGHLKIDQAEVTGGLGFTGFWM